MKKITLLIILAFLLASCSQHECQLFDYGETRIDTLDYQGYRLFTDGSDTVMVEFRNFDAYETEKSTGGFAAKGECKNGFSTEVVCNTLKSSFWMHFLRTDEGYLFRMNTPHDKHTEELHFSWKGEIGVKLTGHYGFTGKNSPMDNIYISDGELVGFSVDTTKIWRRVDSTR
ncbi:hypothetical protein OGH69_12735 [Flavobacterium sp. MFBS3-15]|uniref:hypothetical protein n=1 Tax=Flavobacterium sp. MFBS3-15 TaxID=2989816 RepID=UPI0022359E94|nr:hypothetical protein [Flavobacterium sp. MFBS3-15]MCW4469838.1 hypothetical protein [Flavobacterium sp. MFBS3-15]